MNKRVIVLAVLIALAAQAVKLFTAPKKTVAIDDSVDEPVTQKPKKAQKSSRIPASSVLPDTMRSEGPAFSMSARNENGFEANLPNEAIGEEKTEAAPATASAGYQPISEPRNFRQQRTPSSTTPSAKAGTTPSSANGSLPVGSMVISGGGMIPTGTPIATPTPSNDNDVDDNNSSGPSTPLPQEFTCHANVGSGMFKNPIQVTLSCSNTSNVRYCLAEGACCDPESGLAYSSPVPVGQDAKTYCLSFIGEDTTGKMSSVVQKTYTFNPGLPDILTKTQKYFQTTELNAKLSLDSDDIGKDHHAFGLINTFGHEPALSGLNSCEQIISQYGTLGVPPVPYSYESIAETPIPVSSTPSQIDMFLGTSKLQYGTNWLTTYIKNTTFDETFYACVSDEVILEDFPYFQADVAFAGPGNNTVREFAGGFTSLGFFEPEPTVFRGPAGESSSVTSTQELQTGIFSIFY